ncbi:hypothetical protein HY085_03455 [Candidatus Gottesmanbacteria bacterium]|nr:hypothetical protein [Candidatus Gottesmanbacteria bacterium]
MIKNVILVLIFFLIFAFVNPVEASESYVTLVYLVRGRSNWINQEENWLRRQIDLTENRQHAATWLLSFDAIGDFSREIKGIDKRNEVGILLEVTHSLATKLQLPYNQLVSTNEPQNVFLSGYSREQRQKIIDLLFLQFRNSFGYFPKSVGAWFIDSWSLGYLKNKYGIETAMIVAEQYGTDQETVRGHPWQIAYYPSKTNILRPANNLSEKLNTVIIQWAARDPLRGWGNNSKFSNFSVQANDYTRQGKDDHYFVDLAEIYLFNPLTDFRQLTIGIEVGQEGATFYEAFVKQLNRIGELKGVSVLTMNQFAQVFRKKFSALSENNIIGWQNNQNLNNWAVWFSGKHYRLGLVADDEGIYIRDLRAYGDFQDDLSWAADRRRILFRQVEALIDEVGLRKKWKIFDRAVPLPKIEKDRSGFRLTFHDQIIHLDEEAFSFNFTPFEEIYLPNNLVKKFDNDLLVYFPYETVQKNGGKPLLSLVIFACGAFLFLFWRKNFSAFLVGILSLGILSFRVYSLTPFNDIGLGYLGKLYPAGTLLNGLLAYIVAPLIYLGMGLLVFQRVKKVSQSVFWGLFAETLFFFSSNLGFLFVFYRHLPLDPTLTGGVINNVINFVWFFTFPSLDKLFFAFSAGQMNIASLAAATRSLNPLLFLAVGFFQIINLGMLSLGVFYLLYHFWKNRKAVKFVALLTLVFWSPFLVNKIDLRLPTIADTFLTAIGAIGLALLACRFSRYSRVGGIFLTLVITLVLILNLTSLIKRDQEIFFRLNQNWSDRKKAQIVIQREKRLTDAFLWRLQNQENTAVYIPQGLEQYFFIDVTYPRLKRAAENSYYFLVYN